MIYCTKEKLDGKKLWRIWRIGKNLPKFFANLQGYHVDSMLACCNSPNFLSAKIPIVELAKVFYRQVFLPYGT